MELAQVLGAFLPQDHSAAKRLRRHLYSADLRLAVGAAQHLNGFTDAVLLDDVPEATRSIWGNSWTIESGNGETDGVRRGGRCRGSQRP
jgi:hypothetical protein